MQTIAIIDDVNSNASNSRRAAFRHRPVSGRSGAKCPVTAWKFHKIRPGPDEKRARFFQNAVPLVVIIPEV